MIQRTGEFEKVSFDRFCEDLFYNVPLNDMYGKTTGDVLRSMYDKLQLPGRATAGSAGYDFKAPFGFALHTGESIVIPTGICVKIDEGWWLGCLPRSGLGFKYRVQLANTVGVIDSDYYHSDNEGHIFVKLTNCGDKNMRVNASDGFAQGIFIPYGITCSDDAVGERNGGFGSTGR